MAETELPAVLVEIAEVAGWEAAWTLVREKGGITVYLPRHAGRRHWLTRLVGPEAADKLCAHFAGNHVTIPLATRGQQLKNWRTVVEAGLSLTEMARRMRAHERTASRYRARLKAGGQRRGGGRQGRLF